MLDGHVIDKVGPPCPRHLSILVLCGGRDRCIHHERLLHVLTRLGLSDVRVVEDLGVCLLSYFLEVFKHFLIKFVELSFRKFIVGDT